jgi:SAM-dependent methyltransferase
MKRYYQSSVQYRDDLITHDERFLEPFLLLIDRYVQKPTRVLDLGCGTGLSTRLLNARGYDAIGLDLSPLFLTVEKQENPDTNLLAGNALQLPFADETFDAVTGFEFVEHVTDVPALLREIVRVLKIRGFVILHSPNLLSPYLPAFDLIRLLLGKEGRPVFAETAPQACAWLFKNLMHSLRKKFSLRPHFIYREPDLSERQIGGDADSVYVANPMDLSRYLRSIGCAIDQVSHAMSLKNKILVALTPHFAPYIGLVAHKRSSAPKQQ